MSIFQTLLDVRLRSDRPRYYYNRRWTTPLASAVPRRTPSRASSQLMTSQRKPTTTAISQNKWDKAVDTRVAHTLLHNITT